MFKASTLDAIETVNNVVVSLQEVTSSFTVELWLFGVHQLEAITNALICLQAKEIQRQLACRPPYPIANTLSASE